MRKWKCPEVGPRPAVPARSGQDLAGNPGTSWTTCLSSRDGLALNPQLTQAVHDGFEGGRMGRSGRPRKAIQLLQGLVCFPKLQPKLGALDADTVGQGERDCAYSLFSAGPILPELMPALHTKDTPTPHGRPPWGKFLRDSTEQAASRRQQIRWVPDRELVLLADGYGFRPAR